MKYKDVNGLKEIPKELPFFSREKWKFLWENDRWDGPLAGVCEVEEEKYYFLYQDDIIHKLTEEEIRKMFDEDWEPPWWRRFYLVSLSDEEWKEEIQRHDDFCKYVGEHTDYNENGCRRWGELKPYSEHHKFYDKYGEIERCFDENEVVGWIEI